MIFESVKMEKERYQKRILQGHLTQQSFIEYILITFSPVIHNRGAATHKGAVKRCQGCRQILNLLSFKFFATKGGPNWHFSQLGKGAAKFFFQSYRVL